MQPNYLLLNFNWHYNNELWQTVFCISTFQLHLPFLNDGLAPLPIFNWLFMPGSQPTTQVTSEQHINRIVKGTIICKTITSDGPSINPLINCPSGREKQNNFMMRFTIHQHTHRDVLRRVLFYVRSKYPFVGFKDKMVMPLDGASDEQQGDDLVRVYSSLASGLR